MGAEACERGKDGGGVWESGRVVGEESGAMELVRLEPGARAGEEGRAEPGQAGASRRREAGRGRAEEGGTRGEAGRDKERQAEAG